MVRLNTTYFEVWFIALVSFLQGGDLDPKVTDHSFSRTKRSFGNPGPPCNMEHGVYLEKWDRIDYNRIRFLLSDPRFPDLPSLSTCVPSFEQPSNWGDFFGSRLRTYFVPLQTGNHYFFISSNGGSELFISTNHDEANKAKVSEVDGGFPTEKYEYDRFSNQKSNAVYLKKGRYYYMEAIMKDDHQIDHLEVGLQTPDGTIYKVIPSKFLWTTQSHVVHNITQQSILFRAAAGAGAKAGLSFGQTWAMKSGEKAGAAAGAMAGMQAGASAGAKAGEQAAIETMTKTLEDALSTFHGDKLHKFKITVKDGSVVSVTGPGIEGASVKGTVGGGVGGSGAGVGGGGRGAAGGDGSGGAGTGEKGGGGGGDKEVGGKGGGGGVEEGAKTGGGGQGGGAGAKTGGGGQGGGAASGGGGETGLGAGGRSSITGSAGSTSAVSSSSGAISKGGMNGASAGREEKTKSNYTPYRDVTYIPKPGQDSQELARSLVWRVGAASKIVDKAMYTIHSWHVPFSQENFTLNYCWRSIDGQLFIKPDCQVFIAHVPSLYQRTNQDRDSVSFESACLPGYFMRQKNYQFLLQERDGSELFDKDSSFYAYSVMKHTRNILFNSMHNDWYICESIPVGKTETRQRIEIILDFYNGDPDVLDRCTFLLHPIPQTENRLKNCKGIIGPFPGRLINGQPLPKPPPLIQPPTPAPEAIAAPNSQVALTWGTPGNFNMSSTTITAISGSTAVITKPSNAATTKQWCAALNFINNFGSPFILHSSLKHEGYLVTGPGFKLKLQTDRPELHSHVTFTAEDLARRNKLLLNGGLAISEPMVPDCPVFWDVSVTSMQLGTFKGPVSSSSSLVSSSIPPVKVPSPISLSPARPKMSSPRAPETSFSPTTSISSQTSAVITNSATTNTKTQNPKKVSPPTSFPAKISAPVTSIPAKSSLEKGSPDSASVSSQSMPPVKVPSPINLSPARPKVSSPPAPSISPGNTSSAGGPTITISPQTSAAITISTTNNNAQNLKKISPPTSFPANSSAPDASIPATSSLEKGSPGASLASFSMPPFKVPGPINISSDRPKISSSSAPTSSPGISFSPTSSATRQTSAAITNSTTTTNTTQDPKRASPATSRPSERLAFLTSIRTTSSSGKGIVLSGSSSVSSPSPPPVKFPSPMAINRSLPRSSSLSERTSSPGPPTSNGTSFPPTSLGTPESPVGFKDPMTPIALHEDPTTTSPPSPPPLAPSTSPTSVPETPSSENDTSSNSLSSSSPWSPPIKFPPPMNSSALLSPARPLNSSSRPIPPSSSRGTSFTPTVSGLRLEDPAVLDSPMSITTPPRASKTTSLTSSPSTITDLASAASFPEVPSEKSCPSSCRSARICLPSCPLHCCKRDLVGDDIVEEISTR